MAFGMMLGTVWHFKGTNPQIRVFGISSLIIIVSWWGCLLARLLWLLPPCLTAAAHRVAQSNLLKFYLRAGEAREKYDKVPCRTMRKEMREKECEQGRRQLYKLTEQSLRSKEETKGTKFVESRSSSSNNRSFR